MIDPARFYRIQGSTLIEIRDKVRQLASGRNTALARSRELEAEIAKRDVETRRQPETATFDGVDWTVA